MSKAWSAGARKAFLLLATFLTSATVAASVRSFVVSDQPATTEGRAVSAEWAISGEPAVSQHPKSFAWSRHALPAFDGRSSFAAARDIAVSTERREALAIDKHGVARPAASYGLASYYSPSRTANGERLHAGDLTAAHRTLPFGSRVRVTNLSNGQSVTVRINDRGPFVRGRIVDVSHPAAEKLGLVGAGIAKVKLELVEESGPALASR